MADWNAPLLSTAYATFRTNLMDRDVDAINMGLNVITNPATGFMKYVRASNKFQEYDGAIWQDKLIAIAGGGTGAATAANARTNLGLDTMATQAASNVAITGGTISGLSSFTVSGTISGANITGTGVLTMGSSAVQLTTTIGKIQAISSTYFNSLDGSALTSLAANNITAGGTLPALNGSALTSLNASNLSSGTVAAARLGFGSGGATKFLREDNTWQDVSVVKSVQEVDVDTTYDSNSAGSATVNLGTILTSVANSFLVVSYSTSNPGSNMVRFKITSTTQVTYSWLLTSGGTQTLKAHIYIVEYKNVG